MLRAEAMAPGFHFWVLVCWSVLTMAEGQDVVTPPGSSPSNGNPTDCQIFTLTPPPTTGRPTVTRAQLNPRMPLWTWTYFLQRPGFYLRLPNRPSFLPNYNYGGRYLGGGRFQGGSSSEESTEK
ncbi:odontogenesis associated phosphoprotein [Chionomys nivalis]|uniref:odontogenesis associated phosphoprotein n=1 Tax=Chionomys nivalis TaxID=269649 RepID=UPI0025958574|nr:odontogenesis associated phosphoprotein [Chionomys nivalis]